MGDPDASVSVGHLGTLFCKVWECEFLQFPCYLELEILEVSSFSSRIYIFKNVPPKQKKKKNKQKKKKNPTTPHAFLMHHNWLLTCGLRTFRLVDLGLLTRILNLRRLYVLWNSCLPKSGPLNSGSPCLSPGSAPLA